MLVKKGKKKMYVMEWVISSLLTSTEQSLHKETMTILMYSNEGHMQV